MASFAFASHGSYPVRVTNDVEFLLDGEAAFAAIASAIESATRTVYITCAYASLNFRLRPPVGEQLADLCRRVTDKGVTVALLFWQPLDKLGRPDLAFPEIVPASATTLLTARAPRVLARWDIAKTTGIYPSFLGCHHQKTFVIDGTIAFVGGINMTQEYWDTQSHTPLDDRRVSYDLVDPAQRTKAALTTLPLHDLFTRVTGAAVSDVEANFVERWNGATIKNGVVDLALAPNSFPAVGTTKIQIVRTIAPATYPHTASGEQSIKEATLNALRGATQSVYFENQYFFDDDIVAAVRAAGERGVRVVGLLCAAPDAGQFVGVLESLFDDLYESRFQWTRLDPWLGERVQLYTPVTSGAISYQPIYVHSKTLIVDDSIVISGSANISFTSMDFHSEMCVVIEDAARAWELRKRLWAEHLCCAAADIPTDFEEGANRWQRAAAANLAAHGKAALATRVMFLSPPSNQSDAPAVLDGPTPDAGVF